MKHFLPLLLFAVILVSCNNETQTAAQKTDSTAAKETLNYPFTPKYSINWQPGDEKNALLVLTAFKKYFDGDVAGSLDYFSDSIEFIADKFYFNGKKDSLKTLFTSMRSQIGTMSADIDTWLTAYYPDKKDTWVTVWYKEKWTDKKNKVDSGYYVDDVLVKDGKIREFDEKQRLYPEPKPKK